MKWFHWIMVLLVLGGTVAFYRSTGDNGRAPEESNLPLLTPVLDKQNPGADRLVEIEARQRGIGILVPESRIDIVAVEGKPKPQSRYVVEQVLLRKVWFDTDYVGPGILPLQLTLQVTAEQEKQLADASTTGATFFVTLRPLALEKSEFKQEE